MIIIYIISISMSKENLEKLAVYPIGIDTKQTKEKWENRWAGAIEPEDSFNTLILASEKSFTIGGIADKVSSKADSGFSYFEVDENGGSEDSKSLYKFIDSIDLNMLFTELFVTGNSFFEIMRSSDDKTVLAEHFILDTIRVTTAIDPNIIEGEWEEDESPHRYVQKSWTDEVIFSYKDVLHFKTSNLKTKYYGKSKFYKCADQVALLSKIDQFYIKLLDKGNIKTKLLIDKSWKLNDQQKQAIKTVINDAMQGTEKGFNTAIVPGDMWTLELEDDSETNAFLEYRRDLIKSVCVWCSFPYDLLISDSSNRSTSEVSKEQLNEDIIIPMQKIVLRQLKQHLKSLDIWNEELVDKISFNSVDISNDKEKMEVITWYKKAWIIDANESRELSPYNLAERDDWNQLIVDNTWDKNKSDVVKIEKTLSWWYNKAFISKTKDVQKVWDTE